MRLLLDTCIFLWFISGDERLSRSVKEDICNPENTVYLSPVSVWEAMVKYQIGRLYLPGPPNVYLPEQRKHHYISSLPLDENSVCQLDKLPKIHRDPFDRMLICQAIENQLTLVTVDKIIKSYPVKTST